MASSYFSTLKNAVWGRIQSSVVVVGQEGMLHDSVLVLVGQGKLWFGNSRSFHSIPLSSLSELQHAVLRPGTVSAVRSDSRSVHQRRAFSVVGALSRTLSIPSVSGPSFQICGYHIDRTLSDSSQYSVDSNLQKKPVAALSSENFVSRRKHSDLSTISTSFVSDSRDSVGCRKDGMNFENPGQPNNHSVYGYYIYKGAKSRFHYSADMWLVSRDFHSSPSSSAETASNVSYECSTQQMVSSDVSSEEKVPASKTLKLLSGSCYLPHPDKEETGGEDAHFICDEQAVGVADGVGGWADLGVDSGEYSRELMSNSVSAIQEEPKGSIDPVRVLEKAHSSTRAKGSSTACIIALTDQGLHAINLGDSGFMVVRDGCTVFRSPVQQHDFNFTYQLESGNNGDLPSSGQVFTITIAPGDVIISGTDGLFDNLYNNEITAVVVHALRAGFGPQVTAQKIAALARQRALDKDRQTPFSTAAQEAGFRYYGGKLDDITVVVSYVARSNEENGSSKSSSN